jgi:DnaK suppressor protein
MKKRDLLNFKKRLDAERSLLKSKLTGLQFDVEQKGDEIDEANAMASLALSIRFSERDASLVRKIDHALSKIEDGTYGECGCCGEDIEGKRLEARPTASLCIKCKEEEERKEKSFREKAF